jgi:hypothetical protein
MIFKEENVPLFSTMLYIMNIITEFFIKCFYVICMLLHSIMRRE